MTLSKHQRHMLLLIIITCLAIKSMPNVTASNIFNDRSLLLEESGVKRCKVNADCRTNVPSGTQFVYNCYYTGLRFEDDTEDCRCYNRSMYNIQRDDEEEWSSEKYSMRHQLNIRPCNKSIRDFVDTASVIFCYLLVSMFI